MTATELIETLKKYDPQMMVHIIIQTEIGGCEAEIEKVEADFTGTELHLEGTEI